MGGGTLWSAFPESESATSSASSSAEQASPSSTTSSAEHQIDHNPSSVSPSALDEEVSQSASSEGVARPPLPVVIVDEDEDGDAVGGNRTNGTNSSAAFSGKRGRY